MPYYQYLRNVSPAERVRTCDGLLRLKTALGQQIPRKTTAENLLIATWNIREFDSNRYGKRMEEAIYYIAEIIDHFDLVAVQEVNEDLEGINRVRRVLGSAWKLMFSDVTEGSSGNQERLAFLYDSRKLSFTGLAGELVVPPLELKDEAGKTVYQAQNQLARTPIIVGLRTSWFKFMIATVHILYGKKANEDPLRVEEVRVLSDFLAQRADNVHAHSNNLILLGDFNIYKPNNETFSEITRNFYIPPALQNLPSNVSQNKYYDQIAFRGYVPNYLIHGGIFNYYDYVYRVEDESEYAVNMPDTYHHKTEAEDKARYFKTYWRTHQMSDHLPMWVELKIDFSVSYLNNLKDQSEDFLNNEPEDED
ncbi:endonuclease/exonuclease/phosphatase family protein [Flavilitoribacter nigricans]|uniref:Endonuclease/exonuclease/phosphatase n=1 Tax=Flavilitoribacter nigricans (strain ATCC 23147 / DSM 23189 / NBRC 102662 / NCIMB 1420 / SS-2) TaxID=1122177 RepID=A0A2D0N5C1_FLAN2|nr:endonuclease/exonuclease/phosphatase family protein [Flavilitoribacter nigricans]PHN03637.1 endonuclease/exonuclease/phosphatase [Flavilitoribacter nigricans DSM 23189 = NBRC 102662]